MALFGRVQKVPWRTGTQFSNSMAVYYRRHFGHFGHQWHFLDAPVNKFEFNFVILVIFGEYYDFLWILWFYVNFAIFRFFCEYCDFLWILWFFANLWFCCDFYDFVVNFVIFLWICDFLWFLWISWFSWFLWIMWFLHIL